MKKIAWLAVVLIVYQVQAQQQSGRVVYEFTRQMQMRMSVMGGGGEQVIPRTRTEKIEVLFANNTSLRRQIEEELPDDFAMGGGPGAVNVRMGGGGADDIAWYNFAEGRGVQQREFATKQYLITDSIRKLNWKLTGESKTILGYACQQALTTRIGKHFEMNMDNGKMTRKEIPDTTNIVTWFTLAIPVPAGPDFQGQLPGLILQVESNGAVTYKAIEVSPKVDEKIIKEPKKGKKVTVDEFNKERDKAIEVMQKNGPPGRRMMRGG